MQTTAIGFFCSRAPSPAPTEWGDLGGDRDGQGKEVQAFRGSHARLIAHPIKIIIGQRIAEGEIQPQVPEVGKGPILLLKSEGRPHLAGFLPQPRGICAQPALALELDGLLVGRTGQDHKRIDPLELGRRQAWFKIRPRPASLVDDLNDLPAEGVELFNDHSESPKGRLFPRKCPGRPGKNKRLGRGYSY